MDSKDELKLYNSYVTRFNKLNGEINELDYQRSEINEDINKCKSYERKALHLLFISLVGAGVSCIISNFVNMPPAVTFSLLGVTGISATCATTFNVYCNKYKDTLNEVEEKIMLNNAKIKDINEVIDTIASKKTFSNDNLVDKMNQDRIYIEGKPKERKKTL